MFKFLKEKLQSAVDAFSKKEDDPQTELKEPQEIPPTDQESKQAPRNKSETAPIAEPEGIEEESSPAKTSPKEEIVKEDTVSKKGFFSRLSEKITTVQLSEEKFEELFWELELGLLESNVAVEVIERIKDDLRSELTSGRTARGSVRERISRRLEETVRDILCVPSLDLLALTEQHKPLVIMFVGVNGGGKTTSLAKIGNFFLQQNKTVLFAAGDTFRAAAIDQLAQHADILGIPLVRQQYGSDAAAVAFDAVKSATARGIDVVLIDTAGRLHNNKNLMDELHKIVRVAKPHVSLFVGEATTGNDCVEQAKEFGRIVSFDGVVLTKADVDEQGGAALSVSYITKKPLVFLGVGQDYSDLEVFDVDVFVRRLLGEK